MGKTFPPHLIISFLLSGDTLFLLAPYREKAETVIY